MVCCKLHCNDFIESHSLQRTYIPLSWLYCFGLFFTLQNQPIERTMLFGGVGSQCE